MAPVRVLRPSGVLVVGVQSRPPDTGTLLGGLVSGPRGEEAVKVDGHSRPDPDVGERDGGRASRVSSEKTGTVYIPAVEGGEYHPVPDPKEG